jgi:hypothetical protein
MTGRQEQQLRYQSEASPTDMREYADAARIYTDWWITVDTDNKRLFRFYALNTAQCIFVFDARAVVVLAV